MYTEKYVWSPVQYTVSVTRSSYVQQRPCYNIIKSVKSVKHLDLFEERRSQPPTASYSL
jgi:hypothetical protein